MNKKIEQGCTAIVVAGQCSSNIGKIINVGSYIGEVPQFQGRNWWNCDQPMEVLYGGPCMMQRESHLERIDEEGFGQKITTYKSIRA